MIRALFLFAFFLCVRADEVSFENCGSTSHPVSVDFQSCSEVPCKLVAGGYEDVTVTFVADSYSASVTTDVYLMLYGIKQNLTVTPEPCEGSNTICPVTVGTNPYQYNARVYIPSNMPGVDGSIYWRLKDDVGDSLVCYRVYISIYEYQAA